MKQGFPNVEPIRPGYDWRTRIVLPQAYWDGEGLAADRLVAQVRASRPGPLLAVADTGNATIEREDPRTLVVTLGSADTLKLAGSAIAVFDFVSVDEDGGQRPLDGMWTWPVLPTVTRDIDGTLPAPDPLFSGRTGTVVATFEWTAPQAAVDWAPVVVPGPHGKSFHVVDSAAELTAGFGRDGDTAIIRTTGAEWLKTDGEWAATGASFWGTLLQQGADQVQAARDAAEAANDSAVAAHDSEVATAADRTQTGQDRVATGQDRVATGADRTQTGDDAAATAADRTATNADRLAADADAAAAAASATSTAADVLAANDAKDAAIAQEILVAGLKAGVDTTYAAMIAALASVTNYNNTLGQLTGAAKQIVAAADVVAAIVYDTALDSDGGVWRKRCKAASWFNEGLNTATRGSRTFFPKRALIVARSIVTAGQTNLTIYDLDDSACPMWMAFTVNTRTFTGTYVNTGGLNGLAALNGQVFASGATDGLAVIDFVRDTARKVTGSYIVSWNRSIADRNLNTTTEALDTTASTKIVNSAANAVAATVLPGTPVDPVRKLPNPTVAVATAGGVSVIHWDGRVANSSATNSMRRVSFDASGGLWYSFDNTVVGWSPPQEYAVTNFSQRLYNNSSKPAFQGIGTSPGGLVSGNGLTFKASGSAIAGFVQGLEILRHRMGSGIAATMNNASEVATITSKYNTGYMLGDIKMALADSVADVTSLVGATPLNDDFSTYADDTALQTIWTASGGTISLNAGAMRVIRGAGTSSGYRTFVTVIGRVYTLKFSITAVSGANGASVRVGTGAPNNNNNYSSSTLTVGAYTISFVATGTLTYLSLLAGSTAGDTADFDNVRIDLAANDRSVAGNHPRVIGTVTRAAVAANSELAWEGAAAGGGYINAPGTFNIAGDFTITAWFVPNASGNGYIFDTDDGSGAGTGRTEFAYVTAAGAIITWLGTVTGTALLTSANCLTITRSGTTVRVYLNGVLANTYTNSTALFAARAVYHLTRYSLTEPLAKRALFRLSASAASAGQVRAIYAAEAAMFAVGAKCLLNGSDNVQALDYDAGTDLLYAAKAANGTDVFKGLIRTGSITMASENELSAELLANTTFDTVVTPWDAAGAAVVTWLAGGGMQVVRSANSNDKARYALTGLTVGQTYQFLIDVVSSTVSTNQLQASTANSPGSGTVTSSPLYSGAGAGYSLQFVATAANMWVFAGPGSNGTTVFDNASLKRVITNRMTSNNHKGVSASNDNVAIFTDAEAYAKTPSIGLREAADTAIGRAAASVPYDRNTMLRPGCAVTSNATPTVIASFPMDKGEAGDWVIETVAREYGDPAAPEFALYRDHFAAFRPGEGNITLSGTSTQTVLREVTASMAAAIQANTTTQMIEVLATGVASKNLEWGVKASFFPVAQVA